MNVSRLRLAAFAPLVLAACGDLATQADRHPDSLRVEPETLLVVEGQTATPRVVVLDQDQRPFERVPNWALPLWKVTDERKVRHEGDLLRALAPGQATAIVELAGMQGRAIVRVNPREMRMLVRGAYLTQSIQRSDGSVPLIAGRDALLRVFLVADRPNFFQPRVRATLLRDGVAVQTLELTQESPSVPESVDEGVMEQSWNGRISGTLVQPGLSLAISADPGGVVPMTADSRTRYPAEGAMPLDVRHVPPLRLRVIPIHQNIHGSTGNVNRGNLYEYVSEALEMHPVGEHRVELGPVYTTSANATTKEGWSTILQEIWALRTAQGADSYYYGVLRSPGGVNYAGLGYVGYPASIGYDALPDAAGTLAHELGHNFGRYHSPCGNPSGVDGKFPYREASIGAFGYDFVNLEVKTPDRDKDLMSYCRPRWISDYTFQQVLSFRQGVEAQRLRPQPDREAGLLVWGRVSGSELVLEPAFELSMPPRLPEGTGPYRIEGFDAAGARLFSMAFAGEAVDHQAGHRHFAFAIPARLAAPDRLAKLRLVGPEGVVERVRAGSAGGATAVVRRAADGATASWSDESYPMALIRDAQTGAILSFARGGEAEFAAARGQGVQVLLSDGVRSVPLGPRER